MLATSESSTAHSHVRVGRYQILHVPCRDVLTTPDDDILDSSGNADDAVFVDGVEIPGSEVTIRREFLLIGLWVVEITGKDPGTFGRQLPPDQARGRQDTF